MAFLYSEQTWITDRSCARPDESNILIENGTLKLFAKEEKYLEIDTFTGATIVSKMKLRNVRIEIGARKPTGKLGLTASVTLFKTQSKNLYGNLLGQVDIVKFADNHLGFNMYYSTLTGRSKVIRVDDFFSDPEQLINFSIEWNENYIAWFVNERVIDQVNRTEDSYGIKLLPHHQRLDLLFEDSFYLMFHIGVHSYNIKVKNEDGHVTYMNNLKWERPWLEIDYVRVYSNGENSIVDFDSDEHGQLNESSLLLYYIIIPMVVLFSILVIAFILAVRKLKEQKEKIEQVQIEMTYDDIDLKDDIYDNYDYAKIEENDYEQGYSVIDECYKEKRVYVEIN